VLFDLDGTVIDSYPGIQKAFDNAYLKVYKVSNTTSIKSLIGPPIQKILFSCNGETNEETINLFVNHFKECYDTEDLKHSVLYDGVRELLQELQRKQVKMFIVTNKRERPTKLIMEFLNLDNYFCDFYCSDNKAVYPSKELMVQDLLKMETVEPSASILVGDTLQDKRAATFNNVSFVYAAYGYGALDDVEYMVDKPLDILNLIKYT
jgi:phosphoglycolate phosphatase